MFLKRNLTRIKDAGLSLNKKKCVFSTRNVSFLGYFVENGTIRPDPSRLELISSFPLPTSVKALQQFIGMATYYSKYIQNFSEMCRPLYDKLKDFKEWQSYEINAFDKIKSSFPKQF